jgi:hypothetical protein
MCSEMKEGFAAHEAKFATRDTALAEQQREKRTTTLESAAVEFNKLFGAWKLEVDLSLSSVKLKLSNLISFFDHDAKSVNSVKPGVLLLELEITSPTPRGPTDGPTRHCVEHINRDYRFGQVFT